jgi:hypothetical protein
MCRCYVVAFYPRCAHQLRSAFLHLVETSGRPSTANSTSQARSGQMVPQQTKMLRYLLPAGQKHSSFPEADQHQDDCEMLHWDSSKRAHPLSQDATSILFDSLSLFVERLRRPMLTDKIRFHVILDLSCGESGPHLLTW